MNAPSHAPEETIRVRKLGEKIAERIIGDIIASGWPVGANIGTEPELMLRYGVGRASFREAVRQVERHGAAHMRRGAGGGLIVAERPHAAAIRAMMTFFELTHVSFADQHEVREALEVAAARLGAARITPEKAAELMATLDELKAQTDYARTVDGNMQVRVGVAGATGNPALSLFIEALNGVLREIIKVLSFDEAASRRDHTLSVAFKQRLVEAMARHDVTAAETLVHEDASRRLLAMTSAIARSTPSGSPPLVNWWEGELSAAKLSDRTVSRIVSDIAKLNWKEGHNLGAEANLQPRYKVSRAVLREAIRQLEAHGIVQMKIGARGGLIIGRADPSYTVELVTTYLLSMSIDILHLWETQSSVQVLAARRLAQTATEQDRAALRATIRPMHDSTPESYLNIAFLLHREISERSGNRALALFNRVLIRCSQQLCPPVTTTSRVWLVDMHQKLVDAICDGDERAAAETMTRIFDQAYFWLSNAKPLSSKDSARTRVRSKRRA